MKFFCPNLGVMVNAIKVKVSMSKTGFNLKVFTMAITCPCGRVHIKTL